MRVNLEARRKFKMMYSLSNDNCTSTFININPISYPSNHQVFPHKTFPTIDTCFSLFHPPSPLIEPFEDEVDLLFPYLQNLETTQQPYFSNEDFNVPIISTQVMNNMDDDLSKKSDGKCEKKKCYKKDRHSKIVTSKGPRDRRMRLSLEVAPRFFNLQEMLGFDKASKTLEWLMNKSHLAIMELSRNINIPVTGDSQPLLVEGALVSSTTSECEAISSSSNVVEDLEGLENLKSKKNSSSCNKTFNKKIEKTSRKIRPFSKKTREEARERARKRTLKNKQEKYNNEEVFLF